MSDGHAILVTLIVFQLVMVLIGVWASRRSGAEADFLIGGRSLGPWVAGLSYAATSSSAWVLLGFSGFVFATGVSALWMLPGVWGGYALVWMVLGRSLQTESAARGHITPVDYLAADATGPSRRLVCLTAAALIVFCFLFYIAAQLQAAGVAMQTYFALGVNESVLIGAGVILLYCLLGGFWAVSVTDMVQGVVMAVVAIGAPVAAVAAAGGPLAVLASLQADAPGHLDWFGGRSGLMATGFAFGLMSIGLGTAGQPQLLVRVMAVRDAVARRQAFAIALIWAVAVFCSMAALGLAGRALALAPGNPEQLLFQVVGTLFPPVFQGVALAALLSAVMSTVDSILLISAGAISHDAGLGRRLPGREVLIARVVMTLLCGAAVVITLAVPATIFERVLFAWTALGAAFGPVVVARVMGWRAPGPAVVAAMLTGFTLAVCFNQLWNPGPGAIWERVVPWLPALAILWIGGARHRGIGGASHPGPDAQRRGPAA